MEEDGIGLVLARATELRLKIGNCIQKASFPLKALDVGELLPRKENGVQDEGEDYEEEESDDDGQRLLNICDALESLESQLSSLHALQQQQQYEREVALAEIEQSRKTLLDKLKDYKGEQLEVINEASAFAGETVEQNNDLLLPPYPSHPLHSLHRDNGYFPSMNKGVRNGVTSNDAANGEKKNLHESERTKNSRGLGFFFGAAAKTVFTLVGVASVLSLSGFGPKFVGGEIPLKFLSFFNQQASGEKRSRIICPPGKILAVENGEARCLVKERVEVPFSSAPAKPDVNYGSG